MKKLLWISFCLVLRAQTPDYDLVIRNGRVLDGQGNPWIRADVAIRNGRFVRIGKIDAHGKREIDAKGKYVSPGWIDMLDQSGGVLLANGLAESKLKMGVTTAIAGEGGTVVAADKIPDYFARLEKSGISVNFGSYYSESQTRVEVLGYEAREPSAPELARMQSLMETAMKNGALGMTTALIYPPGSYATTTELIEVAKAAAKYGGIYAYAYARRRRGTTHIHRGGDHHRRKGRPAGRDFPFESRLPTGLGQADARSREEDRSRPRSWSRCGRGHVSVHRGRHQSRRCHPVVGA